MNDHLLELHESVNLGANSVFSDDGTVALHIIRPGLGRGRGKHLYEAAMLQEAVEQGRFVGWKMFVDHQSPEAKKASGGLPRSVRDLGGIIKEAVWDPSVPANAEKGWGEGAVVGMAKPTRLIRQLIEDDPELVEASISATATSVKPVQRGRDTVWLVEGIRPRGSVDWVTEAGAGGRVAPLIEALVESDDFGEELDMLEDSAGNIAVSDDDLKEWLRHERPDLLAEILEAGDGDPEDEKDGGADELAELTEKYLKRFKGNRAMAKKAAARALANKAQEGLHDRGGEVDATELLEALGSDEGSQLLDEAVRESFARVVAPALRDLVEAALEDERELLRAEGRADSERIMEVRDLRDAAHKMIAESKLPETFQAELTEKYDLKNGQPTPALDVLAEEDEETGAIVKPAVDVLAENVEADITRKREQAAELRPTRVRGQGAGKPAEGEGGEEGGKKAPIEEGKQTTGSPRTDAILQEAGVEVDDDLYAGILR